ncbi:MAG: phage terminase large subunit family protein [Opitutaceae bacterium]|jgi:phage terminase large subunit GpA-like protein|nr:phage terminase large subunit family protein [Opitutaceae bacterium]
MYPLDADTRHALAAVLARTDPLIHAALARLLSTIFVPSCPLNCWQWIEANIRIPPLESPLRHGPYDSQLQPHVRRLMEFITTPGERVFIALKSSQIGFTLAYLLIICYLAATAPRHVLFAMDSASESKNISARLKRLILYNHTLANVTTDEGEEDLHNLILKLRAMNVWFVGAGAAGGFANKAAGLVILDELDLYELNTKKGHETFHRALERIKDDPTGKFIAGGKPEEYDYPTNINFRHGTREEIFLPCPHCGHYQPIHWESFRFEHCKDLTGKWDLPMVQTETYVECENGLCPGKKIREDHKLAMLPHYKCVSTNKGQDDHKPIPGWVSLWVNDLTSSQPQHAWGNIAIDFITRQSIPGGLRTFFHGVVARPSPQQKTEVTKSDLNKLNGGYDHGCIPKRPAINPRNGNAAIVLCADNQGSGEKKWVKVGFTPGSEAFVIDYGICMGLHDLLIEARTPVWHGLRTPPEKHLEELQTLALATNRAYADILREHYPDREFYTASTGLIDEGYDTFVIRDFCHSSGSGAPGAGPFFYPCKGIARAQATDFVMEIPDKFRTQKDGGEYITVYHYSDDDLKRELYIGRIGGFDAIKSSGSTIPRLWFPAFTEEWFLTELQQERRELVMHKGRRRWMWIEPQGPNDFGDALKECFAAWHIIRPHFPEADPPPPPPPPDPEDGVAVPTIATLNPDGSITPASAPPAS